MAKAKLVNLNETARQLWNATVNVEVLDRVPLMAAMIERKRVEFSLWHSCMAPAGWDRVQIPLVYATDQDVPGHDADRVEISIEELEGLIEAGQENGRHWLDGYLTQRIGTGDVKTWRLIIHPKRYFCMTPFVWQGAQNDGLDRYVARILVACRLTQSAE